MLHVGDSEAGRELRHALRRAGGARSEKRRQFHPAARRLRMQLEAAPVEGDVLLLVHQPDQAALLRDEAERSDEIGIEPQRDHGSILIICRGARWRSTSAAAAASSAAMPTDL